MAPTPNYVIRPMTRNEVETAIDWAATEGWNPGLHDLEGFYAADPQGFLAGELDGEIIATISAIRYGSDFGFVGFYIVKPEYRGQGYGIQIWQQALQSLAGRNVGLDGVVAQQDNYKKSGFRLAYRNIRFAGLSHPAGVTASGLVELSMLPFEQIEQYDRSFFPSERGAFLQAWLKQPSSVTLGVLEDGQLAGYGMIRPCRSGYKIGPLNAENAELADTLFQALTSRVPAGEAVYLDVPEPNKAAVELAQRHSMELSFETARMYTGAFPELPLHKIFGVTSFELG